VTTRFDRLPAVGILGERNELVAEILDPEPLQFITDLERRFAPRRRELLAARAGRQKRLDAGDRLDFLPHTAEIRNSDWAVASLPAEKVLAGRWNTSRFRGMVTYVAYST
jgi:malate synthase